MFHLQDEVKQWILPPEYDHISAEAKHLLQESDADKVCAKNDSFRLHLQNTHKSEMIVCIMGIPH